MAIKPPPWGLLADDVSGACDSAVAFAAAGFETELLLEPGAEPSAGVHLIAISTDTRKAEPAEAAAAVKAACGRFRARGVPLLFKKIDSVLRGPIAAEIEATGASRAVLTPAFPAQGRTVEAGRLWIRDPASGVQRASDASLPSGPGIEARDAATDADLRRIAEAALEADPAPLLAGSGGLAFALAELLGERWGRTKRTLEPPADPAGPELLIGTSHPVTRAQVIYLQGRPARARRLVAELWEEPESFFERLESRLRSGETKSLFLCGGDTARSVLARLDAQAIRICGETAAGAPWGWVRGGGADGRVIVTKSGGFGPPDTLLRIVERLTDDKGTP